MRAIREVNPHAKLVQTDDLGKIYGTQELSELTGFYNLRRWLGWDLLCAKVDQEHPLWDYLTGTGVHPGEILWFKDNTCPPDIIGINYYITSERWLDPAPKAFIAPARVEIAQLLLYRYRGVRAATPTPDRALLEEAGDTTALSHHGGAHQRQPRGSDALAYKSGGGGIRNRRHRHARRPCGRFL
jgi:dTDP-4-dehydrorhamnose reductase